VEGVTGRYFTRRRELRSSARSYDRDAAGRLWEVSERLTGLTTDTQRQQDAAQPGGEDG
jgi:hypothetical protein